MAKPLYTMIRGLKQMEKSLKNLHDQGTKRALTKAGNLVARAWLQNVSFITPVDTGLLRSNWKTSVSEGGQKVNIWNDTYYAYWVENGHHTVSGSWVEGRFMLRLGTNRILPIIQQAYSVELQTEINQSLKPFS